ncbi:MAG: hypothetical protein KDK45_09795, partial [Leptospiraceae bacterium]|nr:hypothetical protein [Leptospiraceae bacterium]
MNWKELLKFSYKKPQLSEEETRALQKRETLYQKIENAYSRLESIEILNSNSKYEDSTILSGKLALDVLNIGLFLEDEAPIRSLMERETCKNKIKDTKLTQLIEDNEIQFQKLSGDSPPSGEEAETFETFLSQILYYEEKILKKLKNEELHTPIDDYKKRLTLHSILALLILGMGLYIPAKTYLKYRIQADTVNLYYFNEKFPLTENPGTENRIQQALLIDSNWHDYTFALPAPLQVSSIRF